MPRFYRRLSVTTWLLIVSFGVAARTRAQAAPQATQPVDVQVAPIAPAGPAVTVPEPVVVAPLAPPVAAPLAPPPEPTKPAMVVEASLGKGATIKTADDQFTLNIRGRVQARATLTEHNDGLAPATGFQVRRMRLLLQGNALGPTLTYYLQLGFSNLDMEPDLRSPLRDAYITWAMARDASLRVGQMKVPYGRQRVVSSSAQQLVDRSIVVGELNLDRDVGVHLFSKDLFGLDSKLGYSLAVFGGDGRNRVADKFGLLYAARIQVTPMGGFDDFSESDFKREPKPKLAIAVNGVYNQHTNRPRSTFDQPYADARFSYLHAGVDALLKWRGLSVSGEWLWRKADKDARSGELDGERTTFYARSGWGAFGQVAQLVTDKLEVSGRYGFLKPLKGSDPKFVKRQELGGGLSYYLNEHSLKVQGDYFYLPTDGFEGGTHEVRVQSQLYF